MQIDCSGSCCHETNPAAVAAETCCQTAMRRQTRPTRPPPTMPTCAPGCRGRTWAALGGPGLRTHPRAATFRRGPASLRRPTQQVRQIPVGNYMSTWRFLYFESPCHPWSPQPSARSYLPQVLTSPPCPTQQLRQISTGKNVSMWQFRWFEHPWHPWLPLASARSYLPQGSCVTATPDPAGRTLIFYVYMSYTRSTNEIAVGLLT